MQMQALSVNKALKLAATNTPHQAIPRTYPKDVFTPNKSEPESQEIPSLFPTVNTNSTQYQ